MSLFSLKQLLLRKTEDESLRTLIKMVAEDVLADQVLESLEKMAIRKGVGSHANMAIRDFGVEMDPELEPAMIREALGHHASRYKAALAAGDKKMANDHAANFFKIMDLIHHVQPHSHGKLKADMVDIKPWERTHPSRSETFADRIAKDPEYAKDNPVTRGKKKAHQFVNDTVGFGFVPKGNDWSFLQNDPHGAYSDETSRHGHVGAYPMEHVKINGKYIPIEPVENLYDNKSSHPFDYHPIMSHYRESVKTRTPERDDQYRKEHAEYSASPHVESHLTHQQSLIESGAHENRGNEPGEPVHPTSKRIEIGKPTQAESAPVEPVSKPAPQPQTAAPQDKPKVITRKASASDKEKAKALLPSYLHDLLKD
jgi:hypothetical protein